MIKREWVVAQLHSLFDCNLSYREVKDALHRIYSDFSLVESVLKREGEQNRRQLIRSYPHLASHPDWQK